MLRTIPKPGRYDSPDTQAIDSDSEEEIQANQPVVPKSVSEAERRAHQLTHTPFRSWCEACVQGKSKANQNRKIADRKHILQMDFMFLSIKERPSEIATVLTMTDIRSQYSSAVYLPS